MKTRIAPLLRDYEDDDVDSDDFGLNPTTVVDPGEAGEISASSRHPGIVTSRAVAHTIVGYRGTRLPEPVLAPGSGYRAKHPVKLDDPLILVIRWDDDGEEQNGAGGSGEAPPGRRPENSRRALGVPSR